MAWLVVLVLTATIALMNAPTSVEAWGRDGHTAICDIAESFLNASAAEGVSKLLPTSADGKLSNVCSWADEVKTTPGYEWSAPLHYVDTPNGACNYDYERDCVQHSKPDHCAAGAIHNYTAQLTGASLASNNLTEALLFLAHFVGDIHQPLHCGFIGDFGGDDISVTWFNNSNTNLHKVWDSQIIITTNEHYFHNNSDNLASALINNIKTVWSSEAANWTVCPQGARPCTDTYAKESVKMACQAAYANVGGTQITSGTTLAEPYFDSRYPIVEKRLAIAGVRLAAILNTIFKGH
ncbi:unnamed protein product [Calypogeia fissa]